MEIIKPASLKTTWMRLGMTGEREGWRLKNVFKSLAFTSVCVVS